MAASWLSVIFVTLAFVDALRAATLRQGLLGQGHHDPSVFEFRTEQASGAKLLTALARRSRLAPAEYTHRPSASVRL